jgi:hypothetical protein
MMKSKMIEWTWYAAHMGEKHILVYSVLMGKSEGKRLLGSPTHRWEDNIKINLRGIQWGCLDWIHLALDRDQWIALVNTVMNLRLLQKFGQFFE